jgi:hypothetical protein
MRTHDDPELRRFVRLVRAQDALTALLASQNEGAEPEDRVTGACLEVHEDGTGDLVFMRGAYPVQGESL